MKKKSMNDLMRQLVRICQQHTKGRMRAYSAYYRAFESHFGFYPHSDECIKFVEERGLDFEA
jgi:hypothetical protein